MSVRYLMDRYRPARKAAGRPDLTIHHLRHTALTIAGQHGATAAELQARAGHASQAAMAIYQHATLDRDKRLADASATRTQRGPGIGRSSSSAPLGTHRPRLRHSPLRRIKHRRLATLSEATKGRHKGTHLTMARPKRLGPGTRQTRQGSCGGLSASASGWGPPAARSGAVPVRPAPTSRRRYDCARCGIAVTCLECLYMWDFVPATMPWGRLP